MQTQFLTFADLKKIFPDLRPSRLDYLVREGLVQCERNGHGRLRRYPPEAVELIRSYLERQQPREVEISQPALAD